MLPAQRDYPRLDVGVGLVRAAVRAAGAVLEPGLALGLPPGVPAAQRLSGDPRLGRHMADRAVGIHPLAQTGTSTLSVVS